VSPIGALRRRMILEAAIDAQDDSGSMIRSYAPLAAVWADVSPLSGQAEFVAEREEEIVEYSARIRWRADVTSRMRLSGGGLLLLIHSVCDPDGRRRFLLCRCAQTR
jgi:SPP1 family predicted phage head-tail adaptor